ncbi:MAG: DUF4430 domain-containing protein, partial [Clostridiales bacterium]|nr:DUF4430 domain-containing protein [Clostridiales bacterium]
HNLNRILALLMALVLALAMTACDSGDTTQEDADSDASTTEAADTAEEEASDETEDAEAEAETEAETETESESDSDAEITDGEEKNITLTVTYSDGTSENYEITTTAEYLMDAIEDTVTLEDSESDYGFYLETVNGETADYDTDGAYWAIYVNHEYGMYGLDSQPVADGDDFELIYTVG